MTKLALRKAITLTSKVLSLTLLWGMIGYSALFVVRAWWLRGLLSVIAVGVTTHLLLLKTLTREMIKELESSTIEASFVTETLDETQAI